MRLRRATRVALGALLLATTAVPPAFAVGADHPPTELGPRDLQVVRDEQLLPRLRQLTFRTPAADHDVPVRILVPEGYDASGRTRYPVLLLLHGGGGGARDWTDQGDALRITAGYPLIVVMPDVTGYGNYVDWWNGGAEGAPRWETYMVDQLIPWVDQHLPTVGTRAGRAVAGLSMGGGGAMGYAARHPDLFVGAAAFSGAVDTNTGPVQLLTESSGADQGHPFGSVFGHRLTEEVRWRGHNPWDLAGNLRGLFLQLDTGNGLPGGPGGDTGDPVEFFVHEMMTNLHVKLQGLGIAHRWNDYGAGGHAWFYWQRDLRELLPRLMRVFADPPAPPRDFSFTGIEPVLSAYGWEVAIERPQVEFATLEVRGPSRFAVRGTGSAVVTTPARYAPGTVLDAIVHDGNGRRTERVAAGRDGRVEVPVSMGRANPVQAYTVPAVLWALTQAGGAWPVRTATVALRPAVVPSP